MNSSAPSAVVFAYHNVGVRGLSVLLANNIDIKLVVTHADDPGENIWFSSVAELAQLNDIPVITPQNVNSATIIEQIRATGAQWFFSFYFRQMLGPELLSLASSGAYNLHGSLLPKYRGRVPVNWAVLNGESQTGVSLHRMAIKPDAGPLVDQQAVSILINDSAFEVFQKLTCAAEQVLVRSIPVLLNGTATETELDLSTGSYFGGRRPEDGQINWKSTTLTIHNLIRAVAPPYPGAFFDYQGSRIQVLGSYFRGESARSNTVRVYWENQRCWSDCIDGKRLHLTQLTIDGIRINETTFKAKFGSTELVMV